MAAEYAYQTIIGTIRIAEDGGRITRVYLPEDAPQQGGIAQETELLASAGAQLQAYLNGELKAFDLPLAPAGTPFQLAVWQALRTISYGETRSYGEIARQIGRATASRAVGLANGANPIPILIPCHRVIGANGKLVGYRGGLAIKRKLLDLEKRYGV